MSPIAPGEVFLGKYRIEKVLGQGGMGIVVAARHLQLDEPVAIKFLHATFAAQKDQVERFLREGRAAVKIKSEHVARVRDVDVLENGTPYMIMEHLVGLDLGDLLVRDGPLPISEAVEYVLQACECLAEAHTSGIVHRDLKPANLFLIDRADGSPCVKVLDFGISKLKDAQQAALTNTNGMMGSPLYMAPEQLSSSKKVDQRADIWALGVILFELVTAKRPFQADSLPQLVFTVATEPPIPLTQILPDAPRGFEDVIMRCLEKRPDDRIADVGALAKALEPFAPQECQPSIERIVRVVQGTTSPGARRRTNRTAPSPMSSADASQPNPAIDVAAATVATIPTGRAGLNTTNSGTVASERPPEPAAPRPAPKKKGGLWIAGLGAVALIGGIAFVATRSAPPTPPPAAAKSEKIEKSEKPVETGAPVATTVAAPTQATAAPQPSPSEAAQATKPGPKGVAPIAPPKASAKASASATAKPNCDPPYTIDSEGNKHYKMECI
ncbi:MAG: serine/threonine protein kinase [Polyangiales bacterium]